MYFDRFDVCEAYYAIEMDYNCNGMTWTIPGCARKSESIAYRLGKIQFRTGHCFNGYSSLSENGKSIYRRTVAKYLRKRVNGRFAPGLRS